MEQGHKLRVLLLYKAMIPSVRFCGHCQLAELAAQDEIEYRHCLVNHVRRRDLDWTEIIVLSRLDSIFEARIARMLRRNGKTIVYMLDDDLLHVPAEFASGAYYAKADIQANIRSMMALSDAIVSPSPLLLARYAAKNQTAILLEEPAVDLVPYTPHDPRKPVRIGFAGSTDRTGDIERILREVLLRVQHEYGERVEFVFFGAILSCAEELQAKCVPYSASYDDYRRTMNELQLDIGLAPMPETDFHACKHYNKFIEYAAANTVGIFSRVSPYDRIDALFGWKLLCENRADSWYAAIRKLLDHPDELDTLKRRVAELAGTSFSTSVIAQALLADLRKLPEGAAGRRVSATGFHVICGLAFCRRIAGGLKRRCLRLLRR